MGEEEKKAEVKKEEQAAPPEEKKADEEKKKEEEPKKEGGGGGDEKEAAAAPPPPPPEIVLRVYMHCEGCARKVRRCLKGFAGVEEVITDCKSHKVVVKGEKADPLKVLERVQKKSHKQVVELLSPIPKPPEEPPKPPTEDPPKPVEENKPEPQVITVVLKVHMHCEACAQEIKKRILRMKGVESAEADSKSSEVAVKGTMEPQKLLDYVYKKTGKHAAIVKQDPPPPEEKKAEAEPTNPPTEEKKAAEEGEKKGEEDEKKEAAKKGEDEGNAAADPTANKGGGEGESTEENKVVDVLKKNEYYYYPPYYAQKYAPTVDHMYPMTYHPTAAYPPQIFSDENPNACSVM